MWVSRYWATQLERSMRLGSSYGGMKSRRQRVRGVGLLETLAALVILSAGAAVMLTWFSQNATVLSRLKQTEKIEQGRIAALDYVRTLNPVERPSGETVLGEFRIDWTSKTINEPVRIVSAIGTPGKFEISLYELDIQLFMADADISAVPVSRMTLPVAGYKANSSGPTMFGALQ